MSDAMAKTRKPAAVAADAGSAAAADHNTAPPAAAEPAAPAAVPAADAVTADATADGAAQPVTPMVAAAQTPAPSSPRGEKNALSVRSKSECRRRAGRAFTRREEIILLDGLSDEDRRAIEGDAQLIVELITVS
jgi:hypothetical protein